MSLRSDLLSQIQAKDHQLQEKIYEVAKLEERVRNLAHEAQNYKAQASITEAQLRDARRLPTSGDMRAMELRHEATLTQLHAHYHQQVEGLRSQLALAERTTAEFVGQLGAAEQENEQLVTRVSTIHALTCPDCWPDSVTIDTPLCSRHAPVQEAVSEATQRVRDALGGN